MSSSNTPMDFVRQRAAESIFTPISTVPQKGKSGWVKDDNPMAKLARIWPRESDPMWEACGKLWKLYEKHRTADIWALDHHTTAFAVMNAASCYTIGNMYRKTLKTTGGGIGMMINMMGPCLIGSTFFGWYLHEKFVHAKMAAEPYADHDKYFQATSMIQLTSSFLYPMLFMPVGGIYFALRYGTFPIPDDLVKSKESRKYLLDTVIRPTLTKNKRMLAGLFAFNTLATAAITYFESEQLRWLYEDTINAVHTKPAQAYVAGQDEDKEAEASLQA